MPSVPRRLAPPTLNLLFLLSVWVPSATAESSRPWRVDPFTSSPEDLMQACADSAASGDEDILILYIEQRLSFDEQGRRTIRRHTIYQVCTELGRDSWDEMRAGWEKWYAARPEMSARVIGPDGRVSVLDPGTIVEQTPDDSATSGLYTDRAELAAPLPDVRIGSIVEEVELHRDERPFFEAGTVTSLGFAYPIDALDARAVVDAPRDLPLQWLARGTEPVSVDDRRERDRRVVEIELGRIRIPKAGTMERLGWRVPQAEVVVSTGKDWRSIARAYGDVIDERLVDFEVPEAARPLVEAELPRDAKIQSLLRWLQTNVRYTGVFFGETAMQPWPPRTVVERGYGDCKDQATLLVGLLRAAGLQAHVALLLTAPDAVVAEELPGMGAFDHAIVHVGGRDPLWIDPTLPWIDVRTIPASDQGRRALVCAPSTRSLVEIPVLEARANTNERVRRLDFGGFGYADLEETTRARGLFAVQLREILGNANSGQIEEILDRYVRNDFTADSLRSWSVEGIDDLEDPMTVRVVAAGVVNAMFDVAAAHLVLSLDELRENLPACLLSTEAYESSLDPRFPDDVRLTSTFRQRTEYRLRLPVGFVASELPDVVDEHYGPVRIAIEHELVDGEFVATVTSEATALNVSSEDARAIASRLEELLTDRLRWFRFEHATVAMIADGDVIGAVDHLHGEIAARSDDALPALRLSRVLLSVGLGEPARTWAERAVELATGSDPMTEYAVRNLAWVRLHDGHGRPFFPGLDRDGAIEAMLRARELRPDLAPTHALLGDLFRRGVRGDLYGEGCDVAEAARAFRTAMELDPKEDTAEQLLECLAIDDRWDEIAAAADSMGEIPEAGMLHCLSIARTEGAAAAQRYARRVRTPEQERALLGRAAQLAMRLGEYSLAADLLEVLGRGNSSPREFADLVRMLRATRPIEELIAAKAPDDPTRPVLEFSRDMVEDSELLWFQHDYVDPLLARTLAEASASQPGLAARLSGSSVDGVVDRLELRAGFATFAARFDARIEDDGWNGRRVSPRQTSAFPALDLQFVVVVRDGRALLLSALPDDVVLALRLREALDAGRADVARKWVEWSGYDRRSLGDDPFEAPALAYLVRASDLGAEADLERIARVARVAFGFDDDLEQWLIQEGEATDDASVRLALVLARLTGHVVRDPQALVPPAVVEPLLELAPQAESVLRLAVGSYLEAGDEAAALRVIEDVDDVALRHRLLADVSCARGDLDATVEHLEAAIEEDGSDLGDYNDLAWTQLLRRDDDPALLEKILTSLRRKDDVSSANLHTLACVYAERGQLHEAHETLVEGLPLDDGEDRDGTWALVQGLIAERVGEDAYARALYESVPVGTSRVQAAISVHAYARKRLAAMDGER